MKPFYTVLALGLAGSIAFSAGLPQLQVSDNKRFLVAANGQPFFWLGDFIVTDANKRGLYIGFLPTWGSFWDDKSDTRKPLFTVANAEVYGEWLGRRYKDAGLIWILGGDRGVENDEQKEIIRAMAKGLRKGDGGSHLMTLHPPGGSGSSKWFHDEAWLDFNMRQNGHVAEFTERYAQTRVDYDRTTTKPVLDGEPIYEDHSVSFDAKKARPLHRSFWMTRRRSIGRQARAT